MKAINKPLGGALVLVAAFATAAALGTPAMASTASVSGGTLTVQGDGNQNKFTPTPAGNGVMVVQELGPIGSLLPGAGCAVWGTSGRAVVCTNVSSLTLRGAGGKDDLNGTSAADKIYGDAGADTIQGRGGNGDYLEGGGGPDVITGSNSNETIVDTSKDIDWLIGLGGTDTLWSYDDSNKIDQVACATYSVNSTAVVDKSDNAGGCANTVRL